MPDKQFRCLIEDDEEKDEIQIAKSIMDEIIEETESEDFGKEKEPKETARTQIRVTRKVKD